MAASKGNNKNTPPATIGWLSVIVVILLIASAILNVYFYTEYRSLRQEQSLLITENQETLKRVEVLENKLKLLRNPGMKPVQLHPVGSQQDAKATVYWNVISGEVYVLVHKLRRAPDGYQYQLWAFDNDKPINVGVFDMENRELVIRMNNVEKVQAFAVTLENKGGSETPDLTSIILKGSI